MPRIVRTTQYQEALEGLREPVPAGIRRLDTAREIEVIKKKGSSPSPPRGVEVEVPIATTFWGKAWCDNLGSYAELAGRLPWGRPHVRAGAVLDLLIGPSKVSARVQAGPVHTVEIGIRLLEQSRWDRLVAEHGGRVESVPALLRGDFPEAVKVALTRPETGILPEPRQIRLRCSCPDWVMICEHAAAVLLAVGARLDERPEALFRLREVDPAELVAPHRAPRDSRPPVAASALRLPIGPLAAENDGARPTRRVIVPFAPKPVEGAPVAAEPVTPRPPGAAPADRPEPKLVRLVRGAKPPGASGRARRTDVEFRKLGVPDETVAYWVRIGALEPAGEGAYLETPLAKQRLGRYLAQP